MKKDKWRINVMLFEAIKLNAIFYLYLYLYLYYLN